MDGRINMVRNDVGRTFKVIENIREFLNKTKVIKIGITICLCISIIMIPYVSVPAWANEIDKYYEIGHGNNTYGYDDLLYRYRTNSIAYKRAMLDYQIQALNGSLADENYLDINAQHLSILEKIEELEQAKATLIEYKNVLLSQKTQVVTGSAITVDDSITDNTQELIREIDIQIGNIDSQLLQYNNTRISVEANLSEARLSKNISSFYLRHQSMIENEAMKKMENDFLKQCYSLIIYQEQLDYYRAYKDYLTVLNDVDTIRYRYGLVTEVVLDTNEVKLLHNERAIIENINSYEAMINAIRKNTGIMDESKIRLQLIYNKKEYNLEKTIQEFINKNSGYQQIKHYINSYQDYKYNSYISYTSYRQTEARIEYYKLQKEELENSIRAFVIQAINSYESAIKSRDTSWKELQVKNKEYNAFLTKHKYKRASRLDLAKSLYEKEAVELAYYQSSYDVVIWQDIIDNCIYGVEP